MASRCWPCYPAGGEVFGVDHLGQQLGQVVGTGVLQVVDEKVSLDFRPLLEGWRPPGQSTDRSEETGRGVPGPSRRQWTPAG